MSPEQARGKAVNRATDIWAFGCVLYELLSGRTAFEGEDVTEVLAAVVKTEPDWNRLPQGTPPSIRLLLRRCLRKDRRQRFQDATDVRIEIDEALAAPAEPELIAVGKDTLVGASWRRSLAWAAASLLLAAITGFAVWSLKPDALRPIHRLALPLPSGDRLPMLRTRVLALSPDGSRIAFVSVHDGKQQIYLRAFDGMESKALSGTEGAESLFFSPDGKWLGFAAGGKLMKVAMDGGVPLTMGAAANPRGVSWGDSDTIVFAAGFGTAGLSQISAVGGKPQPITVRGPATGEEAHRWAELLPGGKAVLFTAWNRNLDDSQIVVQRLDTHERRILVRGGTDAHYVRTGHLVYARAATLMAVRFDVSRLEVTGEPISIADGVSLDTEGVAQFDISDTGSLAYIPGGVQGSSRRLVWVDRWTARAPNNP